VGDAVGGVSGWTLVDLDHFAFVGRLLIFVVAHIKVSRWETTADEGNEGNGWEQGK